MISRATCVVVFSFPSRWIPHISSAFQGLGDGADGYGTKHVGDSKYSVGLTTDEEEASLLSTFSRPLPHLLFFPLKAEKSKTRFMQGPQEKKWSLPTAQKPVFGTQCQMFSWGVWAFVRLRNRMSKFIWSPCRIKKKYVILVYPMLYIRMKFEHGNLEFPYLIL